MSEREKESIQQLIEHLTIDIPNGEMTARFFIDVCGGRLVEVLEEMRPNADKLQLIESCVIHTFPKNGEVLAKVIEDIINGTITGLLPVHNTENDDCWCDPTIEGNVIIHKEIKRN